MPKKASSYDYDDDDYDDDGYYDDDYGDYDPRDRPVATKPAPAKPAGRGTTAKPSPPVGRGRGAAAQQAASPQAQKPPAATGKAASPAAAAPPKQSVVTPASSLPAPMIRSPSAQVMRLVVPQAASRSKDAIAQIAAAPPDQHLNMVVIGHVDAGKSTLVGHLLRLCSDRHEHAWKRLDHDAEQAGRASFKYAWALDSQAAERSRGITIDVARATLETPHRTITVLDTPGHADFVPNMITGAAQADVCILMIDASRGSFEAGFIAGGQTKEHAVLARSLGVQQVVVAINKLDTVDYDRARYDEVAELVRDFLVRQTGFAAKNVRFVPISGFAGENLAERTSPALNEWYNGPTLIEMIDSFALSTRATGAPFRMCVSDVYTSTTLGLAVSGRVDSGIVGSGDRVLVMPSGQELVTVRDIERGNSQASKFALAGDHVDIGLTVPAALRLRAGDVLCDPQAPTPAVQTFRAQIVVVGADAILLPATRIVLHTQMVSEAAIIKTLDQQLDKQTAAVKRNRPQKLCTGDAGIVTIKVGRRICLDTFAQSKSLGRITLRVDGHTVAAGIVIRLRTASGAAGAVAAAAASTA